MRLALGLTLAALCVTSPNTSAADNEAGSVSLSEIVVTDTGISELDLDFPSTAGSRTSIPARKLPASVESLDSDHILERGDYEIANAITRTTGLTGIGTGGNGGMAFSARGFTGVNSVAVLEDRLRLAPAAGTVTYPNDSWGYERFEVLRGLGSVINGTGTVGATINAVRKRPSRDTHVEALLGIGTESTGRLGVGATGALGEITSFRIDAYGHRSDGFRDLGDSKGGKIMSTLLLEPSSALSFELLADYSDQKPERYWGTPVADGRIVESLYDENYNVNDAIIRYKDTRIRGRANWQVNDWLTLSEEAFYFKTDRHWKNVESYVLDTATQTVDRSFYLEIKHNMEQIGNRLGGQISVGDHRATIGWEATQIDFKHTNNSPYGGESTVPAQNPDHGEFFSPDPTLPKFKTDTTLHAVYVEDAWTFSDNWLLLAGVRWDYADVARNELLSEANFDMTLNGVSWRLGLSYQATPDINLYAQVSSGYDPVTTIVTMNLRSKDFDLTSATQVEAGIKQRFWQGRGEWTAALYHIKKDDIITRDVDNPALSVQGGSQSSSGIELTAAIAPSENWLFEGNLALLDAEFDELIESGGADRAGNRPRNVPHEVANLWAHYRRGDWQLSLGGRYVGKRYANNANTRSLSSYTVLDANLAWKIDPRATLRLLGRNLTDKVYATTAYGSSQYMLGDGRSVELVADLKF